MGVPQNETEKAYLFALSQKLIAHDLYRVDPMWPEDWRDDPATSKQLSTIRSRRCGPNYRTRLPELLYKSVLLASIGAESYTDVETKGDAQDVMIVLQYIDEDVLERYEAFMEAPLAEFVCPECESRVAIPDTYHNVLCDVCLDRGQRVGMKRV